MVERFNAASIATPQAASELKMNEGFHGLFEQ
jgi:hypothetical protein